MPLASSGIKSDCSCERVCAFARAQRVSKLHSWLKFQKDPSYPHAGAFGAYPDWYRQRHRTAPSKVQWMSGVLTDGKPVVVNGPHFRR